MPLRPARLLPLTARNTSQRLAIWSQCVALMALLVGVSVAAGACDAERKSTPFDTGADTAADTGTTPTTPDAEDDADGVIPGPTPAFAFGIDPTQTISAGPFPSDLYLSDGKVALAPIGDDPVVGGLGGADLMDIYDGHIAARQGFSFAAPALFFVQGDAAVDEASLEGKVRIITLSGLESGREVIAQGFWSKYPKAVGVMAAWGDYMMADSSYAVIISRGVTAAGEALPQAQGLDAVLSADEPAAPDASLTRARDVYAPLRVWMAANGVSASDVLVASVFSTEPVVDYGARFLDAVDAFTLRPITARVRYDEATSGFIEATPAVGEGEVDALMGQAEGPFTFYPGHMERGSRALAAKLPGGSVYTGGTLRAGIGAIYHGSFEAPAFNFVVADGKLVNAALRFEGDAPTHDLTTLVPFTLYLCEDHLADPSNMPVAVFSHGGGVTRLDATAMANLNCQSGVATVAADMAFHGTRSALTYLPDAQLIAPAGADTENGYTGKVEGDAGYQTDFVSEGAGATGSVGQLFGVEASLDPLVVEANILSISGDTHLLVRYLAEGDWSAVAPGVSFDMTRAFHQSLSFGTSLTTPLMALRNDFQGVVTSVGSGMILPNIAMAPSNAQAASALAWVSLGLQNSSTPTELQEASFKDFMLGMHMWLYERADPLGYAPYVLRHRPTKAAFSIISTGNSWDETLHNSVQLSYAAAYGLKAYHDGAEWQLDPSVPGAASVEAELLGAGQTLSGNVTYEGVTFTAVNFFRSSACHPQLISNLCVDSFEHPYPPVTPRAEPAVRMSHICEIHHQINGFTRSLLVDRIGTVGAPSGDCASLYGTP
jgi:hypothetical protein